MALPEDQGGRLRVSGTATVLIVEDDPKLSGLLKQFLSKNGFRVSIEPRGDVAVTRIVGERPDVVILDIMLPGLDGLSVCRQVRPDYTGSILMLTARGEDVDEILGLEFGADDYMSKPMRPRVLLARVQALLRRHGGVEVTGPSLTLGELVVSTANRTVHFQDREISLTTAEFDLVWFLAERAGTVVSRDDLYRGLRGIDWDGTDRSIDLRVSRVRRKLGDSGREVIKSLRGEGYMMVAHP